MVFIDSSREPRSSTIALVTDDVYSVMTEHETLGFVHRVGNVYVALGGDVLSHAVELGQSLSWGSRGADGAPAVVVELAFRGLSAVI